MNYKKIWDKTLSINEKIEHEFSIGQGYIFWAMFLVSILCAILIFSKIIYLGFLIFLFLSFYFLFYLKIANAYAFTNKRILIHRGYLSTGVISIEYSKITDVRIYEPFIHKIFTQTGNLYINTAGTPEIEVSLYHVDNPYKLKQILDNLISKGGDQL
ncbi:MAG: PH domain-containing protein [Patescibacteria group bacterium]|nr:PH domain-containing protein [Patescibacteria group bacterium]